MKTSRIQQSVPAMLGILAASVLIGVAYNSSSPLGVRATAPVEKATVAVKAPPVPPVPAADPITSSPAASTGKGYANQTIAMTLEPVAGQVRPGPAPAAPPLVVNPPPPVQPTVPPTAVPPTNAPPVQKPISIPAMNWAQVKELAARGNTVIVDARPAPQYQAEHIPGAISMPAGTAPDAIAAIVKQHGKDKTYIVYCGSGQCGLSKTMAEALIKQGGAEDVRTMPGGFAEYRSAESKPQ